MTSITLSSHVQNSNNINVEEQKNITTNDNYQHLFQYSTPSNQIKKTTRALSYNEERIQSSTNNRLKHLCTRLKRRFSITKEYRTRSEEMNRGLSIRFNNYKSFSSSIDDSFNDFEWPDFEKIYDTIPHCLANALPGLDDLSLDENDDDNTINTLNFLTDNETNQQLKLFEYCKRGKHFRRNAICRRLDKSQYHGQLNTFIQQLMIEKLIRTWT